MSNQDWYILKSFQRACINNSKPVTYHLLNTKNPLSFTGMNWLFCVCSIQYYILYFVHLQSSLFTFHIFVQLALLKYFPLFSHHNIVPASSCLLEWIFSVSFIPLLCFTSMNSSLLPFLCLLSFSFQSWYRAGICGFFISIPQQLFSLSLTLLFHLLSIFSLYSTSLTW